MERLILAETDDNAEPGRNFARRKCAKEEVTYANFIVLDLRVFYSVG